MDLREPTSLQQFRQEVREWVAAHLPTHLHQPYTYVGMEDSDAVNDWFKILAQKNWLAFRWPKAYGGSGFTPAEQIAFVDELRKQKAPIPGGFGLTMVGPLLLEFGTEEQKQRYLPQIASHEEIWCQGYSEPGAGSDLAALQTKAVIEGDHFVVNGQKIWTSRADAADWIFCLVRTNNQGKRQEGISFLLIDMKSPGVSIRPIRQIDGCAAFFETFFDDVKVPASQLVGEMDNGWGMAKALLAHERTGTGTNIPPEDLLEKVKQVARSYTRKGEPVLENQVFRDKVIAAEMDADALRATRLRLESAIMQGKTPGPEASIFKLFQSELLQRIYDLGLEAMGGDAAAWYDQRLAPDAYDFPMAMSIARAMSIYAGSNEVQRNIISKFVLELPAR